MKHQSLILLLATTCLLTGVQTAMAQKVVLHMRGDKAFECNISQLDSITFSPDALNPKVRIGIYETIPSYDVQDVVFYADAQTDVTQTSCLLFAKAGDETFTVDFGTFTGSPLGTSKAGASFAGDAATDYYTTVCPNEGGTDFTLRACYTLVSADGNGEVLHINDASVEVPAKYTRWEPERAYTFIFKIYHKIDGRTGDQSFADVFPIALDAVIVENFNSNVTR